MTPKQALEKLRAGNKRFVEAASSYQLDHPESRISLLEGQAPFAAILSCSDARVPVELIFDQGFDDLFIIRVAGNIVGQNELGSIQYAALHVHTPLIVVLGHTFCGAVTAALAPVEGRDKEPQAIRRVLQQIDPALESVDASLSLAEQVKKGAEANVRRVVNQLEKDNALMPLLQDGRLLIVGGIYDLESGQVEFF